MCTGFEQSFSLLSHVIPQKGGFPHDRRQGIVHVVGDPPGQLSNDF
jgi:hypothetical protein